MGAAVILIGVALMIVIHEGSHFVAAKGFGMKATEAFFGFGPKLWSTRRGETEYGVKAIPLGGYVRIIGMNPFEEVAPEDESRTYRTAPFWKKSIVVLAGIASHLVVAVLIFTIVAMVWGVVSTDEAGDAIPTLTLAQVAETVPDGSVTSPAAAAGFQTGDRITSLEGTAVAGWADFVDRVQDAGGEEVAVGFDREGSSDVAITVLAIADRPVFEDGEIVTDAQGETVTETVGYFGAAPEIERESIGLLPAIGRSFTSLFSAIKQAVFGLWQMIIGFPQLIAATFSGDDAAINDVGRPVSPIGLVRLAGPLESTLLLLALVNVFVAVVNVVPLYPLDGGHFSVALYEKIRGKEPDVRKMMPIAAVVIIFLVTVGLVGVYLDIVRPLQL